MSKARSWCFTLNNWEDSALTLLDALECKYLVYGKETGEEGTPHLQGFIMFPNAITFNSVKAKLPPGCHIEAAKGTPKQAADYCKKDGQFTERGDPPRQGKRTDLQDLVDAINAGERSAKRLRQAHPSAMARYGSFARQVLNDTRPLPPKPAISLYDWQENLLALLSGPVLDRKIHWFADGEGNAGKSTFATYIEASLPSVQVMKPGKLADLAFALDDDVKILIMDCPRSRELVFPYSFLEDVKDGRVFSTKYESVTKHLGQVHVVVFANFLPEFGKLSADRPVITELSLVQPTQPATQVIEVDDLYS